MPCPVQFSVLIGGTTFARAMGSKDENERKDRDPWGVSFQPVLYGESDE